MNRLQRSVSGECGNIREIAKLSSNIFGEPLSFIILQYFGASCLATDTSNLKRLFASRGENNLVAVFDSNKTDNFVEISSFHCCNGNHSKFTGNSFCWTCFEKKSFTCSETLEQMGHVCSHHNHHLSPRKLKFIIINRHIVKAYIRATSVTHKRARVNLKKLDVIDPITMLYTIKSVFL